MNLKLFKKRLRSLYTNWNQHKQNLWGGSDILVISTPPTASSSSISHRFYLWLLGNVFTDTIAIFSSKEIHFICSKQKASLLKPLIPSADDAVHAELIFHEKAKGEDGNVIMDKVISDLVLQRRLKYLSFLVTTTKSKYACEMDSENEKNKDNDYPLVVGNVGGESPESNILFGSPTKKKKKKKGNGFRTVDIKDGVSKFALFAKVKGGGVEQNKEKPEPDEEAVESVFWGFKRSPDEQGKLISNSSDVKEIDIYLQALSRDAEEKILSADVKRLDDGIVMETIKFDDIGGTDESRSSNVELDGWVLV